MTVNEILGRLEGVTGSNGRYMAKCPAHDDGKASLSVSAGSDGKVLIYCHAGCDTRDILAELDLTERDLFADVKPDDVFPVHAAPKATRGHREAEYTYPGGVRKIKIRQADGGKFCYWQHWDGSTWARGRGSAAPSLYTGDKEIKDSVFVVEGEKDVVTLLGVGYSAVSLPDGAKSKWRPEYTEALKGRLIVIIQDNDEPGKEYAQFVARNMHDTARAVYILDLSDVWPEIPEHGDITDMFIEFGGERACKAIAELTAAAQEWRPSKASTDKKTPALDVISAPDLLEADLPPVKFIVDGIFPEGTGIVSAASKIGKSWMVLDMGLCTASGEPFMGHRTNQCGVLYLALEDSKARLKDRMKKVLNGRQAPKLFYFSERAPTLDDNLLDALDNHVSEHPETKLIIIDTLQKIRGKARARESAYEQDYRELGSIKSHLDDKGLSSLFVHHNRKMRDDDDPFNMISGTNAIMGAADTVWTITKDKRSSESATLHITGRDVQQSDTVINFNKSSWRWETVGDAGFIEEQRARREYDTSPIVKTIKKLLEQSPEHRWDGTAKELMEAGKYIARTVLASTAQKLGYELRALDNPLFEYDQIIHTSTSHGSGGKRHCFYYQDLGQFEELPEDVEQEELPVSFK